MLQLKLSWCCCQTVFFSFRHAEGANPPALGWVREGMGALTGLAGMRRTETRGSSSLRMLCKAVNMLSACNPGRHKPQWKKKQDNYRSSNGYEARNHLEMLSKCLFFFFFKSCFHDTLLLLGTALYLHCWPHAAWLHDIITDFSVLIRHPASYSIQS